MTYTIAIGAWVAFLLGAVLYVQRARHPRTKPLAAYLIFVTVFTTVSFVLFATFEFALRLAGRIDALNDAGITLVFLLLIFGPAFLAARWQLRKAPREPRMP